MTATPAARYVHDDTITLPAHPRLRLRAAVRLADGATMRAAVTAALLLAPDRGNGGSWTDSSAARARVLGHIAAAELARRTRADLNRRPPPMWATDLLGPRPARCARTARRRWLHAATRVAGVRAAYGLDDPASAFGPGVPAAADPHGYAHAAISGAAVAVVLARGVLHPACRGGPTLFTAGLTPPGTAAPGGDGADADPPGSPGCTHERGGEPVTGTARTTIAGHPRR